MDRWLEICNKYEKRISICMPPYPRKRCCVGEDEAEDMAADDIGLFAKVIRLLVESSYSSSCTTYLTKG
jgi:hypothetical protein